jgi:hypothetical protein
MKSREKDRVGQFALGVTVLGVGGYIILSSGVFDGQSLFDRRRQAQETPAVQNHEAMAKKWKEELRVISQESEQKAAELEDLTSRLARVRLEIKDRISDLNRVGLASGRNSRASFAQPLPSRFDSVPQLRDFLNRAFPEERLQFETSATSLDTSLYQLVSLDRPFADGSIFLRRAGLSWAKTVSKAAIDLKAADLVIRYVEGKIAAQRAEVLRGYLRDQIETVQGASEARGGPQVRLEVAESSQVVSSSQVDLFIRVSQKEQ